MQKKDREVVEHVEDVLEEKNKEISFLNFRVRELEERLRAKPWTCHLEDRKGFKKEVIYHDPQHIFEIAVCPPMPLDVGRVVSISDIPPVEVVRFELRDMDRRNRIAYYKEV